MTGVQTCALPIFRNYLGSAFRVGKSEAVEFTACSASSKRSDGEMIEHNAPDITNAQ